MCLRNLSSSRIFLEVNIFNGAASEWAEIDEKAKEVEEVLPVEDKDDANDDEMGREGEDDGLAMIREEDEQQWNRGVLVAQY